MTLPLKLFGELSGERSFQRNCVYYIEFPFSLDGQLVQPFKSVKSRDPKENWLWTSWDFQRSLKHEETLREICQSQYAQVWKMLVKTFRLLNTIIFPL